MKNLLVKELRLSASPLSFLFLLFSLMVLIPSYPILISAFFICFGIFHTFQNSRENEDTLFSALLPIRKADAVRARFLFVCLIQIIAFVLMLALTLVRMYLLSSIVPYSINTLMNPNPVFLSWVLLIFALFNGLFVTGFYRTAYKFGRPFVFFCIAAFLTVCMGEALHFIPGLQWLNAAVPEGNEALWGILAVSIAGYSAATFVSERTAEKYFETVDL